MQEKRDLWGTSRPIAVQRRSHARPRRPTALSNEAGPNNLASQGRRSIAAAEPRYMPEVVSETALARS